MGTSGAILVDDVAFANYNPSDVVYGLSITVDKYTITSDTDSVTLTPEFFSNGAQATNEEITYNYNMKMTKITKNTDGTATVSALKNGECTIEAVSVADKSAASTVTLNISGVTPRAISRDIHYYALGNSYMEYSSSSSGFVGWWMSHGKDENGNYVTNYENRGMAASKAEYDYYHRIGAGLKETYNGNFKTAKFNVAAAERSWQAGGTVVATYDYVAAEAAVKEAYAPMVEYLKNEKPNVITIQVQENTGLGISWEHQTIAEWYYRQLYTMIQENRPENSIVVVIPPVDGGDGVSVVASAQVAVIDEYPGFYLAGEISTFAPHDGKLHSLPVTTNIIGVPDYKYTNPHLAYMQYSAYDEEIASGRETVEFRAHPSDYGFRRMAEIVLPIMYEHIPDVIPGTEVIIPDSFEIQGSDTIETDSAYTVVNVAPSTAGSSVSWSVDNNELATVDATGKLTPKRNGIVKITATSVYDSVVYAEKTVEITGQIPHYSITYNKGTTDPDVESIPSSYAYAAGSYTIPTFATTPTRAGYKFVGWSLTEGGETVKSVYMDSDKNVYAVWEFAADWQFNNDGNFEGITFGGMHGKVENGIGSAVTYNSGAASISADKLAIPAPLYGKFTSRIGFSAVENGDRLILTIGTKESAANYTFEKDLSTTALTEYTFDIENVEGTIDYFMLSTSNTDLVTNTVSIDYATFVQTPIRGNVVYDRYEASSDTTVSSGRNTITFSNLIIYPDTVFELSKGNYIIGEFVNNGTFKASPNANIIFTGENKPSGYVEFSIGQRQTSATNKPHVRYAEVNGVQIVINEFNDMYGIVTDKNMLIEITEKTTALNETTVSTRYFHVNAASGTATELTSLSGFMDNHDKKSQRLPDERTDGFAGLRFHSYINPSVNLK